MPPSDTVVLAVQSAVLFLPVAVMFWIFLGMTISGAKHIVAVLRDRGKGIKIKKQGTLDSNARCTEFESEDLFENHIRTCLTRENPLTGEMWYSTSTLPSEYMRRRHSFVSNSSVKGSAEIIKQNSSLPANISDSIRMAATRESDEF